MPNAEIGTAHRSTHMKTYAMTPEEVAQFERTGQIPTTAKQVDPRQVPGLTEALARVSPIELAMAGHARIADHKDLSGGALDPAKVAEWSAKSDVYFTDQARSMIFNVWLDAVGPGIKRLLGGVPVFGANPTLDKAMGAAMNTAVEFLSSIWKMAFGQAIVDFAAGRLPALVLDGKAPRETANGLKEIAQGQLQADAFSLEKITQIVALSAGLLVAATGTARLEESTERANDLNQAGQQIYLAGYACALAYLANGRIQP